MFRHVNSIAMFDNFEKDLFAHHVLQKVLGNAFLEARAEECLVAKGATGFQHSSGDFSRPTVQSLVGLASFQLKICPTKSHVQGSGGALNNFISSFLPRTSLLSSPKKCVDGLVVTAGVFPDAASQELLESASRQQDLFAFNSRRAFSNTIKHMGRFQFLLVPHLMQASNYKLTTLLFGHVKVPGLTKPTRKLLKWHAANRSNSRSLERRRSSCRI